MYTIPGFPTVILAEDMGQVTIRPLEPSDEQALVEFFRRLPGQDRMYLKEDVTCPEVIHRWATQFDYSRTIPLVALRNERVVGEGTLHHRRAGARKHVGEVRVVVDPDFRSIGVGRGLLRHLIELARDESIEKLAFEIVSDEGAPERHTAAMLGFVPVAVLPGHGKDADGRYHDVTIMELDVAGTRPVSAVF